jgi:hypothetical protein
MTRVTVQRVPKELKMFNWIKALFTTDGVRGNEPEETPEQDHMAAEDAVALGGGTDEPPAAAPEAAEKKAEREPAMSLEQYFIQTTLRKVVGNGPFGIMDRSVDLFYRYDRKKKEVACYSTSCGDPHCEYDGMLRVSVRNWDAFVQTLEMMFPRWSNEVPLYPDKPYPCVYAAGILPGNYRSPDTFRCCIHRVDPKPASDALAASSADDFDHGCCDCDCC